MWIIIKYRDQQNLPQIISIFVILIFQYLIMNFKENFVHISHNYCRISWNFQNIFGSFTVQSFTLRFIRDIIKTYTYQLDQLKKHDLQSLFFPYTRSTCCWGRLFWILWIGQPFWRIYNPCFYQRTVSDRLKQLEWHAVDGARVNLIIF